MGFRVVLLAALLALPLTGSASAAPTYCSAEVPLTANADGVTTSDLTFRGNDADDCWGIADSVNDFIGGPTPAGWSVNTEDTTGLWDGGWEVVLKDDGADGVLINYFGLDWTVSAPNAGTIGNWTLTVSDSGAPGGYTLPGVDILGVLKTGDNWAAYLFEAESFLLGVHNGTIDFSWTWKGLSHLTLYMRAGEIPPPPPDEVPVPEPASLMLLGTGLAALAAGARKRMRK